MRNNDNNARAPGGSAIESSICWYQLRMAINNNTSAPGGVAIKSTLFNPLTTRLSAL